MNTSINATKLTGTPCSSVGLTKPCKCGGGGSCTCDCNNSCQVDALVRPRFFAGQLLTEDDLQSLEDYVLAKNRLHNRHFFGAGVVCGLEVLCGPCGGGSVFVQPGYALDCCGNDIVLSCRIGLDINAMVRDLRRNTLGYDCGDPCTDQQRAVDGATDMPIREYCLYLRYCEQESDPVSPYAIDEPCSPQVCEPSRIREGLRFELRCKQDEKRPPSLIAAFEGCLADMFGLEKASSDTKFLEGFKSFIQAWTKKIGELWQRPFAEVKSRLLDLIDRSPHLVRCAMRDKVLALREPVQTDPASVEEYAQGIVAIITDLIRQCTCMAVIPPCMPCDDTAVEIACIKMKDCEVSDICNAKRHFVLTPSALRYWLSVNVLEAAMEEECCNQQSDHQDDHKDPTPPPPPAPPGPPPAQAAAGAMPMVFTEMANKLDTFADALSGMQPGRLFRTPGAPQASKPSMAQPAAAKQQDDISPEAMAKIQDAVMAKMAAEFGDKLQKAQKTLDDVNALRAEVKSLKSAVAKRTPKEPGA